MRQCYISRNYKTLGEAGSKAKTDIEKIMQKKGFENIGLEQSLSKNTIVHFVRNFIGIQKAKMSLKKDDVVLLQYPLKKYYESVCDTAHQKGAKVITLIHDLGSFRRKKLTVEREIERLHHSDVIIAHNDNMCKWLKDNGCAKPVLPLGIFDYLSDSTIKRDFDKEYASDGRWSVCFVGKMVVSENAFLYELMKKLEKTDMYLYGGGYSEADAKPLKPEFVHKMGFVKDFELMQKGDGHFGLSWYGDSLAEGSGKIGEYMSYNNPHKVSLYLRCQMPVIISKTAGLASFVEKEGVGLTVDTLEDIEETLAKITPEQYNEMKKNVERVARKIANGEFASDAIDRALELI